MTIISSPKPQDPPAPAGGCRVVAVRRFDALPAG
jgi:hypothetical protein